MKGTNIMSKNIHATQNWVQQLIDNELIIDSGKNLFDKTKVVLNKMVKESGTIIDDSTSTYFISDYIPVKAGKVYVSDRLRSWNLYDKQYNYLDGSEKHADGTNYKPHNKEVIVIQPKQNGYLRFSGIISRIDTTQLEIGEIPTEFEAYKYPKFTGIALQANQASNVLYDKKWCVIGDSFSAEFDDKASNSEIITDDWYFSNGNFKGKSKTYSNLIADRNNMTIQDMTRGGKTLATPADGSSVNAFSLNDYQNIDNDVDYITIMLGINDGHKENTEEGTIPFGEANDTDNTTFCGAWNVVLPYLMKYYPNTRIGIIVSNGLDNIKYRNATIAAAKKYGIPYIDLNGDERTQAMHRARNENLTEVAKEILMDKYSINNSDEDDKNTHPNKLAHEIEANIIENFLRSL